jgi:hypothetical protein
MHHGPGISRLGLKGDPVARAEGEPGGVEVVPEAAGRRAPDFAVSGLGQDEPAGGGHDPTGFMEGGAVFL